MFFPEAQIRVHLYGQPCDMRKSFDGLQALVRHGRCEDPLSGGLYVFINRRAAQMRVPYFDRSGVCICAKRLEAGRFVGDWSQVRTRAIVWRKLRRAQVSALGGQTPRNPSDHLCTRASGVNEGGRADVSFLADLLVDKFSYYLRYIVSTSASRTVASRSADRG
jgi:transposase